MAAVLNIAGCMTIIIFIGSPIFMSMKGATKPVQCFTSEVIVFKLLLGFRMRFLELFL